ncbi:MAG: AraC family transcriptional regulator [Ruminococcaceae bacterium]|nr:AraC family transcriptional regulator [Oscillospiraceae bacterium]
MATLERDKVFGVYISHSIDEEPKAADFFMHVHDTYEIYCFVSGKASYMVEGRIYDLRPGSLLLMRSAETHKLIVNGSGRYERYVMQFRPDFLEERGFSKELLAPYLKRGLGERNLYLPSEFSAMKPIEFFQKCFRELEFLPKEEVFAANLSAFLSGVCTAFHNEKEPPYAVDRDIGREIIDYINENLSEELSLERISNEVHMSPSQIGRVFRRLTGTSVYDYILSKRLIIAQELISKGENATYAAQKAGFRDYSAFYRLCKKRLGAAPTEVREDIERKIT